MFEKRNIVEIQVVKPTTSADSADTTITVNHGGSGAPPRPEFSLPRSSDIETTTRVPNRTVTHNVVTSPGGVISETHRQINWGGVIKGVAIVAAVALVAVVALPVVASVTSSALGWLGTNTFLGGAINSVAGVVGPALTWTGNTLAYGFGYVTHFVPTFVSHLFAGTAVGGAVAGATTTGVAVSSGTTAAISGATGALAAGSAVAVGVPLAAKAMLATPMVDTVHSTHVTAPVITGMEDGGASANLAAGHSTATHHTANFTNLDAPDVPDHLLHEQMATVKTAAKMAHHAAEDGEHASADHHHDHEDRTRAALSHTARASEAWAERVGGPRQATAVAPRQSEYASELADERSRLDSALSSPAI